MGIINTISYYFKAEKVLESCENVNQLRNGLRYVENYHKVTEDFMGYNVLLRKFHKLYEEMKLDE